MPAATVSLAEPSWCHFVTNVFEQDFPDGHQTNFRNDPAGMRPNKKQQL